MYFLKARYYLLMSSDGFRGGEPAPPPPLPLGRRTDAVTHGTHDMWQRYCIMSTPSPVYLFKHIKHGTEYSKWLPPVAFWQL